MKFTELRYHSFGLISTKIRSQKFLNRLLTYMKYIAKNLYCCVAIKFIRPLAHNLD